MKPTNLEDTYSSQDLKILLMNNLKNKNRSKRSKYINIHELENLAFEPGKIFAKMHFTHCFDYCFHIYLEPPNILLYLFTLGIQWMLSCVNLLPKQMNQAENS